LKAILITGILLILFTSTFTDYPDDDKYNYRYYYNARPNTGLKNTAYNGTGI
jgi:hypothetical protein